MFSTIDNQRGIQVVQDILNTRAIKNSSKYFFKKKH